MHSLKKEIGQFQLKLQLPQAHLAGQTSQERATRTDGSGLSVGYSDFNYRANRQPVSIARTPELNPVNHKISIRVMTADTEIKLHDNQ